MVLEPIANIIERYLAIICDSYALQQLHRKHSSKFHFRAEPLESCNLMFDTFYTSPEIPEIAVENKTKDGKYHFSEFAFKSDIESDLCNKYCKGYCYENSKHQGVNVIFVHGWRSDSFKRLDDVYFKFFKEKGYNMYYINLPYHMKREPDISEYSGELMLSADVNRTLTAFRQAASDLRALIKWVRENRAGKIVLIGLSLGGLVANLASMLENRVDALVSIFCGNNLAYSMFHTIPGKYIKKDFQAHGFTYEHLESYWNIINPSKFKPITDKNKVLLFCGLNDKYVAKSDLDKLCEAWEHPKRIVYNCGHSGIALKKHIILKDTYEFLKNIHVIEG